jgi:hypothetical protein
MYRYVNISVFAFVVFALLASCGTAQQVFYTYKVDSYYMGQSKEQFTTSHVISCGDYLVEFRMRTNYKDSAIAKDGEIRLAGRVVTYDTLGVYLLTPDRRYFEFDTFTVNANMRRQGPIADKEFGIKPVAASPEANKEADATGKKPTYSPLVDTVINNIACYYTDEVRNKSDSFGIRVYLVKNKQLTSIYKLLGGKWPNGEYCIVGMQAYLYEGGDGHTERIAELRPLTTTERKICESLITKVGLPLPK